MDASAYDRSDLIVLDEVGSTNIELLERAAAGAGHGTALRARVQTSGRGRRAHSWASPDGGLYLSILLRAAIPARVLPGLPIACGLGVLRALEEAGASGLSLKWPNDIVSADGKLGGILVEARANSSETIAVCGIGINYHAPRRIERVDGALPVSSLDDCLRASPLPGHDDLARSIRARVLETTDDWRGAIEQADADAAPLTGIVDAYNERLAYRGRCVRAVSPDGATIATGTFTGVDLGGCARLLTTAGKMASFDSVDASLRPVDAQAITTL